MSSGLWSMFGLGAPAPAADTDDLSALLRAVLPTFVTIVERTRDSLPEPEAPSSEGSLHIDDPLTKQRDFYLHLTTDVGNLQVILDQWDPTEIVQSMLADEAEMNKYLGGILFELESRFLSRKADNAGAAYKRLGIEQRAGETYWRLRALRRILPDNDKLGEDSLKDVGRIVRMDNKSSGKQKKLLGTLREAWDFFYNLQPFREESDSPCPIRFVHYPLRHLSSLTKTLFDVVQTNWCCQCPSNTSHISRKTRLSLTQHQRFETAPVGGRPPPNREARFRILFPTTSRDLEWQDTEIKVSTRDHERAVHVKVNGLCGVIQGVKAKIRPRMVVYAKQLWQLQADIEASPLSSTQLKDAEFMSLRQLLEPIRGKRYSLLSSMDPKDRLILSFVLATSLLHFYKGPWLQTSINSDSICFLVSHRRSTPDITRPYLTTNCSSLTQQVAPRELNQPHQFPDILSLGIVLLEIERGAHIEIDEVQDQCVVAIEYLDKWKKTCRSNSSRSVPDGLYKAIVASIDPREYRGYVLDKMDVNDLDVRKYIFEKILHPLEDALDIACQVKLSKLHADLSREVDGVGSFDHQYEYRGDKLEASDEWFKYLDGVHDLFFDCKDRCKSLKEAAQKATRVKVAVLDTGLQLPGSFQEHYEEAERINVKQSESFVPAGERGNSHDWRTDRDGHGSRVGQIILEVAPGADLHVAKVFQTRRDLADEDKATKVHKRIVDAIKRATNEWKVDMIVMSFGFDEPIPLIWKALDEASKSEKPPLFFAATRNNGAHEEMAWPAKDMSVIGISSTAGDGDPSSFNPSEGDAHPILYAFGEGVPVKVVDPRDPNGHLIKHVSGTSYAAPVAAALAANLLASVRMLVETASKEDRETYVHVPSELRRMSGMVPVLRRRMLRKHHGGVKSLLPWEFLKVDMLRGNKLLEDVAETLRKG